MLLAELHSRISAEAGGEVACALRIDWILRILTQQIRESVPSQYSFPTIDSKIRAGLDFGVGNIQLTMDQGKVMLSGFTPVILVKEPLNTGDRSYTTIQLEYTEIPLTLAIVDNCPKLFVEQYETTGPPVVIVGKIETKVLDDNKITEQEFLVKLEAFKFSIPYLELLNRFVNSLSIPNVLSALTLFTLQPPYKFFNIGDEKSDYIAVTGRTELSEEAFCDCKSSSVKKGQENKTNTAVKITGEACRLPFRKDAENMNNPEAIFYIPKLSFGILSDSIVRPAVSASDEGMFLLFDWKWNLTATLATNINISFNVAAREIVIETQHKLYGSAEAGITLACIYQKLVGAGLEGSIAPSKVTLQLSLDEAANGQLYSKYECDIDVDLHVLAGLDLILNPIFDSILDKLIKNKFEARLQLFNNRFLDLNKIQSSTTLSNWIMSKSFESESFCIGVCQSKD